jgi:hypothetical protein
MSQAWVEGTLILHFGALTAIVQGASPAGTMLSKAWHRTTMRDRSWTAHAPAYADFERSVDVWLWWAATNRRLQRLRPDHRTALELEYGPHPRARERLAAEGTPEERAAIAALTREAVEAYVQVCNGTTG